MNNFSGVLMSRIEDHKIFAIDGTKVGVYMLSYRSIHLK